MATEDDLKLKKEIEYFYKKQRYKT